MKPTPIILDTNLLVLFVVGAASRQYIEKHKRLSNFVAEDYDALLEIVLPAPSVLVTPNTLTETSNLAAHIGEPARSKIFQVLRKIIETSEECYVSSRLASQQGEFLRLGLTDAAIIKTSSKDATVLTTDLDLYLAVLAKGVPAINFNHLRDQYLS